MDLILRIDFSSGMHHGDGFGIAGVVDRSLLRNSSGEYYLGGSALKGKFRFAALRILETTGERSCAWTTPCRGRLCRLCQVFGSIRHRGAVIFNDAFLCEPERTLMRELLAGASLLLKGGSALRATTAINRLRRTVQPQHLFTTEVTPPRLRFESRLSGGIAEHRELLEQCASLLNTFGSGSARGLGFCTYRFSEEPALP
jgi:CRISPR/Cas system CSM-associated protein Csm3 (group 7 of RAMP superfamily)